MTYREFERLVDRLANLGEIVGCCGTTHGYNDPRTKDAAQRRDQVVRSLMFFAKEKFTL